MEKPDSKRVFFALWPDERVRGQLEKILSGLPTGPGRAHHPADLHLTLEFIGAANEQYREGLRKAAARVEFKPFTFELWRFGYFSKAKVVAVEPAAGPPLLELARALRSALRGCGHEPERRAYNPHVTLLRKSPPPPLPRLKPFEPILWTVDRFCLAESQEADENGRRYRVLEELPAI
jgi:2'-5' RNA ligase